MSAYEYAKAASRAKPPTTRQLQILLHIHDAAKKHGRPPTIREIGAQFGITSTNGVNDHLKYLEAKGLISRGALKSRSCVLTRRGLLCLGEDGQSTSDRAVAQERAACAELVRSYRAKVTSPLGVEVGQFRLDALADLILARGALSSLP